ncbi:diguanylate cyclase domain-containing protein [Virgibacillus flavescens]|uniref:diguanylate cyclase domain-containing protein n=1 Tax=Virgibacillus flavescens TaxID=1611422 RepID=UPI003D329A2C
MDEQVNFLQENQNEWIKQIAAVVTDCIFLMKVVIKENKYYFVYDFINKPAMKLARLTKRDIGRNIIESNSIGHARFIRERYTSVMETKSKVIYKDNVILPNGQYEARTQLIPIYNSCNKITYILGVTVNLNQLSDKSDDVKYLNRLFSTYMDTTDNGVALIDFSGKFLLTNESFITLFKYTKAELMNINFSEFQPHLKNKSNYFHLLKKGEKIHNLSLDLYDKVNKVLHTTISFTPIPNEQEEFVAFAAIIHNITEEVETKRQLTVTQERYQLIAEHTLDMVNIIDEFGVVKYASPSHLHTIGYHPSNIIGKPVLDFIHENDKKSLEKNIFQTIKAKKPLLTEFRLMKKSGDLMWVESHIKPVANADGSIYQIVTSSRDITNRVNAEEKLQQIARTDYLTGLPNKREFINNLTREKRLIDTNKAKFMAVFYVDGDGFKKINDVYGHNVGDKFLIKIGQRLKSILSKDHFIARIGGDEFAILLKNISGEEEAFDYAKRIVEEMKMPVQIDEYTFTNTLSIGISMYPSDDRDIDGIMVKADKALYQAKKNGKNMYFRYS